MTGYVSSRDAEMVWDGFGSHELQIEYIYKTDIFIGFLFVKLYYYLQTL